MVGNEHDDVLAALGALHRAIRGVQTLELQTLGADEMRALVLGIETARSMLGAVSAAVLARFDDNGDWVDGGAHSAANWVGARTGTARRDINRRLRLANRLRRMPVAAAAFAAAEITEAHVQVLARCLQPRTRDAFASAEAHLVAEAKRFGADDFAKLIEHWIEVVDPDGSEPAEERPDELVMSETAEGRLVGRFSLSRTSAIGFLEAMTAKYDELFHRDRLLAAVDPHDHSIGDLPATRRARALVELVEQGAAAVDPERRRPTFVVLVDETTMAGHDAGASACHETVYGSVVPRRELAMWSCDAEIARLVMRSDRVPLELGRSVRTATAGQRAALRARDGGCAVPGCDRPANWCDAHHIVHWRSGGRTDLSNLVLLCRYHHRRVHGGRLEVRMIRGRPRFFGRGGHQLVSPERATAVRSVA